MPRHSEDHHPHQSLQGSPDIVYTLHERGVPEQLVAIELSTVVVPHWIEVWL
jgi:hypothetical protein